LGEKQVQEGAVIRVKSNGGKWVVVQSPDLQGALISIDARTGAVQAIAGGYDFYQRSFNRATQAWRQPGSTFKPFIYSAGIEKGFTSASVVNDAPIEIPGMGAGGKPWRPKNSNGRYAGYITLRQALVASKNMVTIRIMMAVTPQYVQDYIQRFGFKAKEHPATLAMSLGSGSVTPMQMAEAYAIFANGGYRVSAYIIDKIYDGSGRLRAQTKPLVAGENAKLAIDPRNAFIINSMLRDVVRMGTASRANALGRADIYGKTGTTNQGKDAWFVGYNPHVVTAVYVGFDQPASLGSSGYGGVIALPVWVEYMKASLKGKPVVTVKAPAGLVQRGSDYFYQEYQSTNPNLGLDNRASGATNESGISDEGGVTISPSNTGNGGGAPAGAGAGDAPTTPSNGGGTGTGKSNANLDALF
jgi:penicillin-binding protein 1A